MVEDAGKNRCRTARAGEKRPAIDPARPGLRSRWDQMRTNTLPDNPSLAEQQTLKAFDS